MAELLLFKLLGSILAPWLVQALYIPYVLLSGSSLAGELGFAHCASVSVCVFEGVWAAHTHVVLEGEHAY